jgi:hypothetical protein
MSRFSPKRARNFPTTERRQRPGNQGWRYLQITGTATDMHEANKPFEIDVTC